MQPKTLPWVIILSLFAIIALLWGAFAVGTRLGRQPISPLTKDFQISYLDSGHSCPRSMIEGSTSSSDLLDSIPCTVVGWTIKGVYKMDNLVYVSASSTDEEVATAIRRKIEVNERESKGEETRKEAETKQTEHLNQMFR